MITSSVIFAIRVYVFIEKWNSGQYLAKFSGWKAIDFETEVSILLNASFQDTYVTIYFMTKGENIWPQHILSKLFSTIEPIIHPQIRGTLPPFLYTHSILFSRIIAQ